VRETNTTPNTKDTMTTMTPTPTAVLLAAYLDAQAVYEAAATKAAELGACYMDSMQASWAASDAAQERRAAAKLLAAAKAAYDAATKAQATFDATVNAARLVREEKEMAADKVHQAVMAVANAEYHATLLAAMKTFDQEKNS
jgi:hypothetical protein